MTEARKGPAILGGATVPPDLCPALSRALERVIDLAFGGPGKAKVEAKDMILFDFTAQVHANAAAVSAERLANMQVNRGADSARVRTCEHPASSQQEPVWLRTEDAAAIAGTSARTLRREIDRGVLAAARDRRGYLVDLQSLIAYVSRRRDEDNGKAT